jgi:hypothetical protein
MELYFRAPPYTYFAQMQQRTVATLTWNLQWLKENICPQYIMQNHYTSVIFKQNNPFWQIKDNGHVN